MKLAIVSPLPPDRSGVADFTARLAEELGRHYGVEARREGDPEWLAAADVRLYQMGNNSLHAGAYDAALACSGIVELHDSVLHHFYLGRLSYEEYVAEHLYNSGESAKALAERLWGKRGRSTGDEEFFRAPLLKRVVEHAKRVIVHNPAAREAVRQVAPEADIYEIPHFAEILQQMTDRERVAVRADLGLREAELLISCFGFQRPSKRLRSLLRAADRLGCAHRVLVAGEFVSSDYERSLTAWLESDTVIRRPYLSEDELQRLIGATDICVNLRWPAAGESSGVAMRAMGLGVPVAVTAGLETSEFPDTAVVRIDPGVAEEDMLAESLQLLAGNPELRSAIGLAGREHLRRVHGMERVIGLYREAIETAAGRR